LIDCKQKVKWKENRRGLTAVYQLGENWQKGTGNRRIIVEEASEVALAHHISVTLYQVPEVHIVN